MEDSSIVSRSQMNTVHRNPIMNNQKIATVLKNHRSSIYRDREILSEYKADFFFNFNFNCLTN
jgi:hypothetical protein